MRRIRSYSAVTMLTVCLAFVTTGASPCVFSDSLWHTRSYSQRDSLLAAQRIETLSPGCMRMFVRRMCMSLPQHRADTCIPLIARYCRQHRRVYPELLYEGVRRGIASRAPEQWGALMQQLERFRPSLSELVGMRMDEGMVDEADSLLQAWQYSPHFKSGQYIRWIRVKILGGRYDQAAHTACKAIRQQPRVAQTIREHLVSTARRTSSQALTRVLTSFMRCYDTTVTSAPQTRRWFIHVCDREGLYDTKLQWYTSLSHLDEMIVQDMLRTARVLQERGRVSQAFRAVRMAYTGSTQGSMRQRAAGLLALMHHSVHNDDSVAYYMARAGALSLPVTARAVTMYQRTGRPQQADSLIGTLPPGIARDTLRFRQQLFFSLHDSVHPLYARMDTTVRWRRRQGYALLWRLRAAIFQHRFTAARVLLDSLRIDPRHDAAHDVLYLQYVFSRFRDDTAQMAMWAQVRRCLYMHAPHCAQRVMDSVQTSAAAYGLAVLEMCRYFTRTGQYTQLCEIAQGVSPAHHPAIVFYYGNALIQSGDPHRGCSVLRTLLLTDTTSIFMQKAASMVQMHCHDAERENRHE